MARPPSVTRIKRDGVEFISNVDRVKYSMAELERAALMESAKLIRRRMIDKLKTLPGMKRHIRIYGSTQYWVRRIEADLQIGFKHDSWYGAKSELGDSNQPARGILRDTVFENIDQIRIIQGKYLAWIEDENRLMGLINEEEYTGDEQGD